MFAMHASAAQFDYGVSDIAVGPKVEFTLAIKARICGSHRTCLQPIRSDNLPRAGVLHNQVVADGIEPVHVAAGRISCLQPLAQLQIED